MKTIINKIALIELLVLIVRVGNSQGFANLNFESANLTGYSPGNTIPAANAFPGWVVSAEYIPYDDLSLSGNSISIIDTKSPYFTTPIQGAYYAFLASGNTPGLGQTISLGQSGTIPLGTESMSFWGNIGGLQISFAGQSLAFSETGSTANYNIYSADVSALAGQAGNSFFPCQLIPAMRHWIISSFHLRQFPNRAHLLWAHLAHCFSASAAGAILHDEIYCGHFSNRRAVRCRHTLGVFSRFCESQF